MHNNIMAYHRVSPGLTSTFFLKVCKVMSVSDFALRIEPKLLSVDFTDFLLLNVASMCLRKFSKEAALGNWSLGVPKVLNPCGMLGYD